MDEAASLMETEQVGGEDKRNKQTAQILAAKIRFVAALEQHSEYVPSTKPQNFVLFIHSSVFRFYF